MVVSSSLSREGGSSGSSSAAFRYPGPPRSRGNGRQGDFIIPSCRARSGIHRAANSTAGEVAEPWTPERVRGDGAGEGNFGAGPKTDRYKIRSSPGNLSRSRALTRQHLLKESPGHETHRPRRLRAHPVRSHARRLRNLPLTAVSKAQKKRPARITPGGPFCISQEGSEGINPAPLPPGRAVLRRSRRALRSDRNPRRSQPRRARTSTTSRRRPKPASRPLQASGRR